MPFALKQYRYRASPMLDKVCVMFFIGIGVYLTACNLLMVKGEEQMVLEKQIKINHLT